MNKIKLVAAMAATVFAAPAFAQDMTGGRVEAQIGYDNVRQDLGSFGDLSTDGVLGGVALGYDYDLGSVVLGGEANVTFSTAKIEALGEELRAGRDFELSARLGFKTSPRGLLYAKAGWTNASLTYDDGVTEFSDSDDGFRLGAGYEQGFGTNTYAKGEYRYSDYGDGATRHQIVFGLGVRF